LVISVTCGMAHDATRNAEAVWKTPKAHFGHRPPRATLLMSKLSENSDSDTDSDATLEEQDLHCPQCDFGHPLERVPRSGLSDDDEYDPSISGQAFFQEFYGIISCASSSSDFSTTSSVIPDM